MKSAPARRRNTLPSLTPNKHAGKQGVYILSHSRRPGVYKVGITNKLDRRLTEIDVSMKGRAYTLFFTKMTDAHGFEKWLHRKYHRLHEPLEKGSGRTEWFNPDKTWTWPTIGALTGLLVWALWFRHSGAPVTSAAICGGTGYAMSDLVFVLWNIILLSARKGVEILFFIICVAAVVYLIYTL